MSDRLRAGKPSRYVASQLGRLSLLQAYTWRFINVLIIIINFIIIVLPSVQGR